jgi:hypothetical protein
MTTASTPLQKAKLIELDANRNIKSGGKTVTVQFNPESLKVNFSNQIVQANNAGGSGGSTADQSNQAARQYVGAGTTKLTFQLWFDVGAQAPTDSNSVTDVRELTKNVAYFITPQQEGTKYIPPTVSFQWGSFKFDGIMDSLDESLEFFSDQGIPLRASMSVSMSQQRIEAFSGQGGSLAASRTPPGVIGIGGAAGAAAGTTPIAQATSGSSLQAMASVAGQGANWQAIAEANGIENPRQLQAGALINLNVKIGS